MFTLLGYKVFVHWKLKLLNFLMDSVLCFECLYIWYRHGCQCPGHHRFCLTCCDNHLRAASTLELPCEQRLHFRGMSWCAKSSYFSHASSASLCSQGTLEWPLMRAFHYKVSVTVKMRFHKAGRNKSWLLLLYLCKLMGTTFCKLCISFAASCNFSAGSMRKPRTYPPLCEKKEQ